MEILFFKFYSFIYFWLCWLFALWGLFSSCYVGFSLRWLLLLLSMGCKACRLQYRLGSVVVAPGLSCPAHAESSWTRDWTLVPCIGRQIFNHWPTKEVQKFYLFFLMYFKDFFLCGPFSKSLLNLLQYCFCFMFLVFCPWGVWDLNSLTRDQNHAAGLGRWSLNHWTPREVLEILNIYTLWKNSIMNSHVPAT